MMNPDPRAPNGPAPFAYFVCPSQGAGSTQLDRSKGVYLRGRAEARFLQPWLDPLFDQLGIGISPSSDAQIVGAHRLAALQAVLNQARRAVQGKEEAWTVQMGYALDHESLEIGSPVFETASKGTLLAFLNAVIDLVRVCHASGGGIHIGGGE